MTNSTGVGCYFLLQEIFLTQELKPPLLHGQILYRGVTGEVLYNRHVRACVLSCFSCVYSYQLLFPLYSLLVL